MEEKDRKFIRMVGVLSTAVLTPAFAVGIGFFIGLFLDRRFGTAPWLTALFVLLGVIAGVREVCRSVKRSQQMLDGEEEKKNDR